jgi:hypothetical protein
MKLAKQSLSYTLYVQANFLAVTDKLGITTLFAIIPIPVIAASPHQVRVDIV